MQIIEKDISVLKPYEQNPRKNAEAVKYVANSIKEFGFKVPVVIDKDNVIVAGHTRLLAAKKLKMKTVPCIIADDLTDEQVKAFRLADNKTAEFAAWDNDLLALELVDLSLDMTQFGFENLELPKEIAEDDAPAVEETTTTKRGDIFILGEHRLMCGDSTDGGDVALLMDGEKADMIFTDPPYNVNYSDKVKRMNEVYAGDGNEKPIENDNFATDDEAAKALWHPAFTNMYENAKDVCSVYMTMPQGGTHMMMMMMMMMQSGWQVKHELIWVKNAPVLSRADYNYQHEPVLFGWKKQHKWYGKGEFKQSTWEISKPQKNDLHPTMKPIRLITNALLNSSKGNDIIMDLFGGSGSTLIACEQTNRKCRMMEIDALYCDVIVKRWENLTGGKAKKIGADAYDTAE